MVRLGRDEDSDPRRTAVAPDQSAERAARERLSPSVMCARLAELGEEVRRLEEAGIGSLHFDVMDGHFVPNLALSPDIVRSLREHSTLPFYVHAMVQEPERYVDDFRRASADMLLFHLEASAYPHRLIKSIGDAGMIPGVAINPITPVEYLESLLPLPYVLVVTVEPGFAGGDYIEGSPARVRSVRRLCGDETRIIVDGHINLETAAELAAAGADIFVGGTASIFNRSDAPRGYGIRIQELAGVVAAKSPGSLMPDRLPSANHVARSS
jgi:ribulose-phosphate 3-epimerase